MIHTAWLYKYLLIYTIYISVDDTYCTAVNISLLYTTYVYLLMLYTAWLHIHLLTYTIYIYIDDVYCMAIQASLDIFYTHIC